MLLCEETRDSFLAPNFLSGALWVFAKMLVAFFDVSIDGFSS